MKISFDFDNTLSKEPIQEWALTLINRGFEIWITTARNEGISHNGDLFKIAEKLSIPIDRITFCNQLLKKDILFQKGLTDFIFHIDDDPIELDAFKETDIYPVYLYYEKKVNSNLIILTPNDHWKLHAEKIISKYLNTNNMFTKDQSPSKLDLDNLVKQTIWNKKELCNAITNYNSLPNSPLKIELDQLLGTYDDSEELIYTIMESFNDKFHIHNERLRWVECRTIDDIVKNMDLNDITSLFEELGFGKNSEIYQKLYQNMGYSLIGYWEIFLWEVNNPK